jgi:nitrite reductase/ring-hydroxylating ferredoxin subunit
LNAQSTQPSGPNLSEGVAFDTLADGGMLAGHVGREPVLLVRRGDEAFAIGAVCTHYGAPLADGLIVDETVRCPWHHACFSLRTGEALRAPALNPISAWRVERRDGRIYAMEKLESAARPLMPEAPGIPRWIERAPSNDEWINPHLYNVRLAAFTLSKTKDELVGWFERDDCEAIEELVASFVRSREILEIFAELLGAAERRLYVAFEANEAAKAA